MIRVGEEGERGEEENVEVQQVGGWMRVYGKCSSTSMNEKECLLLVKNEF
jgi:hypothetical protein